MDHFSRATFERDLVRALGIDGGEASEDALIGFLLRSFSQEESAALRATISQDLQFFRSLDPASSNYSEMQILSIRRGMAAIAAHRIFERVLAKDPSRLFDVEIIAKYVQKDTNVEIHPSAKIGVPFAIDHGHSTVIGATTLIGRRAFIYHGVTLGASRYRSRTDRRHPRLGDDVYLGNGSQVLGPCVLEDEIHIACDVHARDCYLSKGVHLAFGVRLAGVVVPQGAQVVGFDQVSLQRYAVRDSSGAVEWVDFPRFVSTDYD